MSPLSTAPSQFPSLKRSANALRSRTHFGDVFIVGFRLFFRAEVKNLTAESELLYPEAQPSSGFFHRGPQLQVFVAGVEEKATSYSFGVGTVTRIPL